MPELMAWADVAVSGSGSTTWELAFMGLPGMIVVLADNQCSIARELESAGVAIDLGWYAGVTTADIRSALAQLLEAEETRAEMTRRGQQLVEGRGVDLVAKILRSEE